MVSHSGVTTSKEHKSGLNVQLWSYIRPVSETAFQASFVICQMVLSNPVQGVGVRRCHLAHIISCGFIV